MMMYIYMTYDIFLLLNAMKKAPFLGSRVKKKQKGKGMLTELLKPFEGSF